jgi:HD superfamily phosphohydrolase
MTLDPSDRTRSIVDSVHGLIRLTPEEMRIIDHPLFQRLRAIKQNGLLHLVFPAATHTRFEHSLGALFVATSMLDAIVANSKVAAAKTPPRVASPTTKNLGEAINFSELDSLDLKMVCRITRLAALVHDLGHGPLSHTFDAFAPSITALGSFLQDPRLKTIRVFESFLNNKKTDYGKIEHDAMSCLLFALIWGDRDPDILLAVCAAILGKDVFSSVPEKLQPWVPLINDLIASAPADADRMDYLERDSRSLGVTYGLFDRNRILKTLLCYKDEGLSEPCYRLGLKKSGIGAIENLVQARFELYFQIYYHKTNSAASLMLDTIARDAIKNGVDIWKGKSLQEIVEGYLTLTDETFLRILRGEQVGQPLPDSITTLARQVSSRRLWKRMLDCEYKSDKGPNATQKVAAREAAELQSQFPNDRFLVFQTSADATKDLFDGARLLTTSSTGIYSLQKDGKSWQDASTIIRALSNRDLGIARIYLCSDNEERAVELRQLIPALGLDMVAAPAVLPTSGTLPGTLSGP